LADWPNFAEVFAALDSLRRWHLDTRAMMQHEPQTLVEALLALPPDEARGFRFRALDGTDRFFQWREVEREARRRGGLLLASGLQKGERLALVIAEPHEFVLTFLGAVLAGIVPVPLYPRSSFKAKNAYVETVAHIVRAASARALVTLESTRTVVEEVLACGTPLERILIAESFFSDTKQAPPGLTLPKVEPDDLCFLQFTSGSTSMPKGVMVTHRNLIANAHAFLGKGGLDRRPEDVAITWLPLFHDMGLIGFVLGTIVFEIPTVLLPTESFARRPTMWMQAMHDYAGTITFAPNFAYSLAVKRSRDKDLEGLDLSKIRIAGCGAEPINPQVMRAFADHFGRAGFKPTALMPSYGMAESTLAISFHAHGTPIITDRVSAQAMKLGKARPAAPGEDSIELLACGRAFPGHGLKIVDEAGRELGERQVGEILARGPSITVGYYGNPQVTAECYRDGWLHTGDLGYLVDGNVYVCGRMKDLIIIRGANFHPQDIEWAVADVPGVRRDNVVAFSVIQNGEETLVISAEGNSTDAPQLRQAIAQKVTQNNGLTPGHVAIVKVGSLPKTSSGKAQRRRTKQLFEQGLLEEHPL
jgi:fatty-acyl-CoA synthase